MTIRSRLAGRSSRPQLDIGKKMVVVVLCFFLLHSCQGQRDSTGNPANSKSKEKEDMKHASSKLNSSVSFGVLESDIAAIFKRVAIGATTSYRNIPVTENKTTTTSTTTSTTTPSPTTTTTSTTAPPPVIPALPPKTLNYDRNYDASLKDFDVTNIESNSFPNDEWISGEHHEHRNTHIPPGDSNNNSYHNQQRTRQHGIENSYRSNERYGFRHNNLNDQNAHTRDSYESSYLHDRNNNFREITDKTKAPKDEVEIHQVVDYGWMIHVYLTGVLMGVVAAMAIGCIPRIRFCSEVFPRNFFVTMHCLVFLAALLRCILLFNGSFGEANSQLPKVFTGLLINSVPPCLTAAFALVLLVYLKATHLYILPMKYQSSFVLAVICVIHIVASVIVDICAGVSESESVISALRAGIQAITAGWGILLCLAFIYLIVNVKKNEEMRSVIPMKSLKVIYVSVAVQLVLAGFLIYGIAAPVKKSTMDNTWSVWILASVERLLEACFCVTLVIITTTFTVSKCDPSTPQEQKVFSVMTASKRDGGLGRSANVYPVTTEKGAYIGNGLFNGALENENTGTKSENYYSGWIDKCNTGTIDSITSDFHLLGKGTSTMSTVLYPQYGENSDDTVKDTYVGNGQESSTSYSTLSSYRPVTGGQMCYCNPVAQCCPIHLQNSPQFAVNKPTILVPQYSHPQSHGGSLPPSEESTAGSSYYGSSLASSHIYSSPQYYTCPNQVSGEVPEMHVPVHLHQCSEMQKNRLQQPEDNRHIPSASLPILQDLDHSKHFRPQQPLPPDNSYFQGNSAQPSPIRRLGQQIPPPNTPSHIPTQYLHPPHVHNQSTPNSISHQQKLSKVSEMADEKSESKKEIQSSSSNSNSVRLLQNSSSSRENNRLGSQQENSTTNGNTGESSSAIETIEVSDCSFLNKLVKSPEGKILSDSLKLDENRRSQRKKQSVGADQQSVGLPVTSRNYHMALDDSSLPSQIV